MIPNASYSLSGIAENKAFRCICIYVVNIFICVAHLAILASLILRKWRYFVSGCKSGSYGVSKGSNVFMVNFITVKSKRY